MIDVCVEGGFEGIEIREAEGTPLALSAAPEQRRAYAAAFQDAGIAVTDIASGLCLVGAPGEREAALESFKRLAAFAADFRAGGVRVFLGNFCVRRDSPRRPLDVPALVETLRLLCGVARESGTQVWIETHNEYATGKRLAALLADIGEPGCRVIWDILHPIEDGEPPEETLRMLGGRCAHIHIKDGRPSGDPMAHDWVYTEIGGGALPIAHIVGLLESSGYRGFYSCEWENKWRRELQRPDLEARGVLMDFSARMRRLAL